MLAMNVLSNVDVAESPRIMARCAAVLKFSQHFLSGMAQLSVVEQGQVLQVFTLASILDGHLHSREQKLYAEVCDVCDASFEPSPGTPATPSFVRSGCATCSRSSTATCGTQCTGRMRRSTSSTAATTSAS